MFTKLKSYYRWKKEIRRLDKDVLSLAWGEILGYDVRKHLAYNNRKWMRMLLHESRIKYSKRQK